MGAVCVFKCKLKLDFGINYPSDKTSKEDLDVGGAGLSAAAGEGGGGVGEIHGVKCCSGLESLTCTEIWLLHITLLLSAESKANSPKHLN